jgi:metal-sulfur cluster biosynthetic enzyme
MDDQPKPSTAPPSSSPSKAEASGSHAAPNDVMAGSDATSAAPSSPPPTVEQVKLALRKVKDPELNLNIMDLGLVYEVAVDGSEVQIDMTLTSPGCPAGPQIMGDVERVLKAMPGVSTVTLNLVWTPFWTPDKIEPRVRAYMGI